MSSDPRIALTRLRRAAASGELDDICERHSVRVLNAFGSAVRDGSAAPRDLDLAVSFLPGKPVPLLDLINDLMDLAGTDNLDVMSLDRADPVARERGLVRVVPLYQARPGDYATMQMAAILDRMDTAWLRRLDLELMSK